MAKKDISNDHGDSSAPKGLDSPGTFAPLNRKSTEPGDGLPSNPPSPQRYPNEFTYPPKKG